MQLERQDRTDAKLSDVIQRVGLLEIAIAGLRSALALQTESYVHLSVRMD
jgi:hypothetical protein